MYLFYRAFAYIKKQLSKTILLLILFFVIGNIVLAGLSVQSAASASETNIRQEIGSDVTYSVNTQLVMSESRSGVLDRDVDTSTLEGVPTYSNVKIVVNSNYVSSYDAIMNYEITSDDLTPYTYTSSSTSSTTNNNMGDREGFGGFISGSYESSGDFSFTTFTTITPTDFSSGTSELIEGRFATQSEIDQGSLVVIINEEMADTNGLSVGDSFEAYTTLEGYTDTLLTYEIIGIYSSNEVVDDRMAGMIGSSLLTQNKMYTPLNTLLSIGYTEEEMNDVMMSSVVIKLVDPKNLDAYISEAKSKINLEYGSLSANDQLFEQLAGSIESLGSISSLMVIIVVIAGAAILSLITALTVNQRKNEIGVLLSIGESKGRIILQFITEVVVIAVIAFTLSIFSGVQVGKLISESTLSSIESNTNTEVSDRFNSMPNEQNGGFNRPGEQIQFDIETPDLEIGLNSLIILEFFAAGLLISIISVSIPALYVTRFNPKQILTNNG